VTRALELLQRFEVESSNLACLSDEDRRTLDLEIDALLRSIAGCNALDAAEAFFKELDSVQWVLARLAFKHGVQLSRRQREIVREFDRGDDPEVQRRVFQRIKRAEFPWCED
jgi:hypothetical protein